MRGWIHGSLKQRSECPTGTVAQALVLVAFAGLAAGQGTMLTLAGNGNTTFSGDGGPASAASLNHPRGLAVSAAGTVYVADVDNMRIRAFTPNGGISTVAGNGVAVATGDGGLAVSASISDAMGLALDAAGNLYIADATNRRVRKIATGGMISTVAGVGVEGFSGDGGPATQAQLGRPLGLALDGAGNLYIADSTNNRIRRVAVNGTISTVAGNGVPGFSGDGGLAVNAAIKTPTGVAVDKFGNVYIADADNNRIRLISPSGVISTFAGTGAGGFSGDGGPAVSATLNIPYDVALDGKGNLYIADAGNNRVRKVDPFGIITTAAGTGTDGFAGDGGPAAQARLSFPWGLAADPAGNIYIADRVNSRIREISIAPFVPAPPPSLGPPSLQPSGVVNGASFLKNMPVAPGAITSIFGTDLAASAASFSSVPLPSVLGETSVTFNGVAAPLFYVSPTQINLQAPFDLPNGTVSIQVRRGSLVSTVQTANVFTVSPGIFVVDQASNAGAILHADFTPVSGASPARAGETVLIFSTGLGAVRGSVRSGDKAPSSAPLADTLVQPTVTIGGFNAAVTFSGLAPGFVGLYQVNAVIPSGLPPGSQWVQIVTGGLSSNVATVMTR